MVATYSTLINTYPPEEAEVTGVWIQLTTVLLAEKTLLEPAWKMVQYVHLYMYVIYTILVKCFVGNEDT